MDQQLSLILGLVGPVLTIIVGLFSAYQRVAIARLNDKIENEKNLREQWQKYIDGRINEIILNIGRSDEENAKHLDSLESEFRGNLNEWARGEREFFMNILNRHDAQISELFNKKVAKEVCDEKHRWNGTERRRDYDDPNRKG